MKFFSIGFLQFVTVAVHAANFNTEYSLVYSKDIADIYSYVFINQPFDRLEWSDEYVPFKVKFLKTSNVNDKGTIANGAEVYISTTSNQYFTFKDGNYRSLSATRNSNNEKFIVQSINNRGEITLKNVGSGKELEYRKSTVLIDALPGKPSIFRLLDWTSPTPTNAPTKTPIVSPPPQKPAKELYYGKYYLPSISGRGVIGCGAPYGDVGEFSCSVSIQEKTKDAPGYVFRFIDPNNPGKTGKVNLSKPVWIETGGPSQPAERSFYLAHTLSRRADENTVLEYNPTGDDSLWTISKSKQSEQVLFSLSNKQKPCNELIKASNTLYRLSQFDCRDTSRNEQFVLYETQYQAETGAPTQSPVEMTKVCSKVGNSCTSESCSINVCEGKYYGCNVNPKQCENKCLNTSDCFGFDANAKFGKCVLFTTKDFIRRPNFNKTENICKECYFVADAEKSNELDLDNENTDTSKFVPGIIAGSLAGAGLLVGAAAFTSKKRRSTTKLPTTKTNTNVVADKKVFDRDSL